MGGDRPLVAGRPQPEVELVEHALGGRRRDRRDQPLRQPREIVRWRERLFPVGLLGVGVVIIEQDQVDVGAGGQLAAAELAKAQDRHPGARHAAMAPGEFGAHRVERRGDRQVGEIGKGLARPR